MNRVVETILCRRSVRDGFLPKSIPDPVINDVLRCGLAAPSSKNGRPWLFHVVTARPILEQFAGLMEDAEGIDSYVPSDLATGMPSPGLRSSVLESAAILRQAPVAIFVEDTAIFTGGRQALARSSPESLRKSMVGYAFEVMGVGAAVENMWLAAVAHGVSAVFLGDVLIVEREIARRLGVNRDLLGALALGYGQADPPQDCRPADNADMSRIRWISGS